MNKRFTSLLASVVAMFAITGLLAAPAMAQLPYGYIVAIGKPLTAKLQDWSGVPGQNGQWPHYHITFNVNGQTWDSAIDLSTSSQTQQSRHRELLLPYGITAFDTVFNKADGKYVLPTNASAQAATGGALDYIRHPGILQALDQHPWSNLDDTNNLIQPAVNPTATHKYDVPAYDALFAQGVKRVYVFGEPYTNGLGVHQVHQNQGDTSANFAGQNGIWQDGAVILEMNSQTCSGNVCKPNCILLMARFADQLDYTQDYTWNVPAYGHAYNPPVTDIQNGQVVGAGSWKYFGPYTAEEAEIILSTTTPFAASPVSAATAASTMSTANLIPNIGINKNLDLYVNYGRVPSNAYANAHVWTNRLNFWERLFNTSNQSMYIAVHNNGNTAVTFNLSTTYTVGPAAF
ncbi:DUF2278 family protein [Undibacterium sp. TJN19]|uniref:DUF2278 family protein n=1 Tax=Undibacterium sp. TJN19 TaxID=3413055 RepID=UPI003BF3191C